MWPRSLYQVKNVFSSSDPVDHLLATKKNSIERLFQCAKCILSEGFFFCFEI